MATETQSGRGSTRDRGDLDALPLPHPGGRGARKPPRDRGPAGAVVTYYREVIAELRKVIYPGRSELLTYVIVVLVFVSFMTAVVAGLDYLATKVVLAVFA